MTRTKKTTTDNLIYPGGGEVVKTVTPYSETFVPEGDFLTLLTPLGFATARLSDAQFKSVDDLKEHLRKQICGVTDIMRGESVDG